MRYWVFALAPALAAGCGNVSGPGPDGAIAGFTLSLLDPDPAVPLDGSARIAVQVARAGGFAGEIAIAGASLPAGLTVQPGAIPADATTGEVIVSGAAPLVLDGRIGFDLQATAEGASPASVSLSDVPVIGRPGSVDISFGPGGGLGTVSFGADDGGGITALHVANGRVYATGYGVGGLGAVGMRTIRFTAAGVPDPEWNGGRLVGTALGSGTGDVARGFAIGLQPDGRPVVIGLARNPNVAGSGNLGAVRFSLAGGGGGSDFGSLADGRGIVDLGADEIVSNGAVLASGALVGVGQRAGQFVVAKLTPSGFLDTTFVAPAGYERLVRGVSSLANAVVADAQGRLLVAGTANGANDAQGAFLLRYREDGIHDGAFGAAGEVTVTSSASERSMAVRVSGEHVYLATFATEAGTTSFRVRRYTAAGVLDPAYGTAGVAELVADGVVGKDMLVLPDGGVLVLGNENNKAYFGRFTREGRVDTLFGPNGDGVVRVNIGTSGAPTSLAVYGPHKIVFGGSNEGGVPGPGTHAVVGRLWL